jgi:hypothetical protein
MRGRLRKNRVTSSLILLLPFFVRFDVPLDASRSICVRNHWQKIVIQPVNFRSLSSKRDELPDHVEDESTRHSRLYSIAQAKSRYYFEAGGPFCGCPSLLAGDIFRGSSFVGRRKSPGPVGSNQRSALEMPLVTSSRVHASTYA